MMAKLGLGLVVMAEAAALWGAGTVLPADLGAVTRTGGVVRVASFASTNRALTIAFEICPEVHAKGRWIGNQALVCANGNGYDQGFRLTLEPDGVGNYRAGFRICPATGKAGWVGYANRIPATAWTALAVTWNGAELRLYKDGVTCATSQFAGPLGPANGGFTVGPAGYGIGSLPFDVRDFLVTGTALDERAVCARATGGAAALVERAAFFAKAEDAAFVRFRPLAWRTAAELAAAGDRANAGDLYARLATVAAPDDDGRSVAERLAGVMTGPAEIFVSPTGSDTAAGTKSAPFATPLRARDELRRLRKVGRLGAGAIVWLRGGRYEIKSSLALAGEDSGAEGAPIVWRAWSGERPVLDGGRRLSHFATCGRGSIRVAELGTEVRGIEPFRSWGFGRAQPHGVPDLFGDKGQTRLARYPNAGFLPVTEADPTNGWVKTNLPEPTTWAREKDLLALGYFHWLWADRTAPVSVDPATGAITLRDDDRRHVHKGTPICFLNALAALDEPGEWCLDVAERKLYVWPHAEGETFTLTQLAEPFVRAKDVHHVAFEGLVFEYGAAEGVRFENCSDVVFCGNVIRRCASGGTFSGKRIVISDNVLRTFAAGGLTVYGGNRRTLEPSEIRVENNEISDIERRARTYCPAVHAEGVGTVIAHNRFHDCPSSAMRLEGNDFLIASNVVERCVTESDDQGAVDIYANPTYAGIRIIGNIWRDCGIGSNPFAPCGQCAVRFDDIISAVTMRGNRFYNCGRGHFGAVQVNGGRLNVIDNNLFVDCVRDVSIGGRTPEWWRKTMTAGYAKPKIDEVKPAQPPYATRYPYLKDILSWPAVNTISRNIYVNVSRAARLDGVNGCRHLTTEPKEPLPGIDQLPKVTEIGPTFTTAFRQAKANYGKE